MLRVWSVNNKLAFWTENKSGTTAAGKKVDYNNNAGRFGKIKKMHPNINKQGENARKISTKDTVNTGKILYGEKWLIVSVLKRVIKSQY